jgi:hypothetical protein
MIIAADSSPECELRNRVQQLTRLLQMKRKGANFSAKRGIRIPETRQLSQPYTLRPERSRGEQKKGDPMKRTLFLLFVVVLFAMFAVAQTSSSTSSSTTTNPSTSSSSTMSTPQSDTTSSSSQTSTPSSNPQSTSPSGSAESQSSAGTSGNSLDGCIVKEGTEYFIQPTNGSPRVKLNTSEDLSAHVGHHVKVEGTPSTGSSNASNMGSSSTGTTGSSNMGASSQGSSSGMGETFNVTRVDMISTTCPTSAK